jgi:hypothetical protein
MMVNTIVTNCPIAWRLNNSYVNIFDTLTLAPVDRIQKHEIILPKYFSPEYSQEFKTNILIHRHYNLLAWFNLSLNIRSILSASLV